MSLGVIAASYVATAPSTTPTDAFADAPLITLTEPHTIVQGDNTGFGTEASEPTSVAGYTTTRTAWLKINAPFTGSITLSIRSRNGTTSPFDALTAVYTGTALNNLVQIVGSDPEQLRFDATAGTTYYVQVGGYNSAAGQFDVHITTNDALSTACPLTSTSGSRTIDGRYLHHDGGAGEPSPLGYSGGTAWWKVTTGGTGGAAQFDTIGTNALEGRDSIIAVYTSSSPSSPTYASLTLVAQDDQSGGNNDAKVTPTLLANTTYFIQVMPGFATTGAKYVLNWSVPSVA